MDLVLARLAVECAWGARSLLQTARERALSKPLIVLFSRAPLKSEVSRATGLRDLVALPLFFAEGSGAALSGVVELCALPPSPLV